MKIKNLKRLQEELIFALTNTSQIDLALLTAKLPFLFMYSTGRRVKNAKRAIVKIGQYLALEGNEFYKALLNKKLKKYFNSKYSKMNNKAIEINEDIVKFIKDLSNYIKENPKTNIANVLIFVLGAYLGSGGIDGDGGIPDTDLFFGIGDHRSIFTHTIFIGIIIEVLILFFILAVDTVYDKLPKEHSEIWDLIYEKKDDFLLNFTNGVSAGLAYHFAIDATIDGISTYKNLPFSAPLEVHQFIMGANAFIEGIDTYYRKFTNSAKFKENINRLSFLQSFYKKVKIFYLNKIGKAKYLTNKTKNN